tara:strand:+ start:152 stop:478 length:327 start_codon:yes stop_codon:yes gene_type:complete
MGIKIKNFGDHIRHLRENSGLTLKEVASNIGVDTSLLSKIERSERQANDDFIKKISSFFHVRENFLKKEYLSDQIAYKVLNENDNVEILKVAEQKIKFFGKNSNTRQK